MCLKHRNAESRTRPTGQLLQVDIDLWQEQAVIDRAALHAALDVGKHLTDVGGGERDPLFRQGGPQTAPVARQCIAVPQVDRWMQVFHGRRPRERIPPDDQRQYDGSVIAGHANTTWADSAQNTRESMACTIALRTRKSLVSRGKSV